MYLDTIVTVAWYISVNLTLHGSSPMLGTAVLMTLTELNQQPNTLTNES